MEVTDEQIEEISRKIKEEIQQREEDELKQISDLELEETSNLKIVTAFISSFSHIFLPANRHRKTRNLNRSQYFSSQRPASTPIS